jgi:SAM-dependent methyltransferase
MFDSLINETELPGRLVTVDTLQIISHRYFWAKQFVSGQYVFEVGCGPGFGLGYLSGENHVVIGGDITWESLRYARNHYGSHAKLIQMDATRLPFKDGSLDTIICLAAVIYIDMSDFLKECRRVLKNGGTLIINTPNKDVPGFKPSSLSRCYYSIPELNSLLKQNNFDAKFFGAFVAPKGWRRIKLRILAKITRLMNSHRKFFEKISVNQRIFNFGNFGWTLRGELAANEIRLIKDIDTQSLPPHRADTRHRIIYVLGVQMEN